MVCLGCCEAGLRRGKVFNTVFTENTERAEKTARTQKNPCSGNSKRGTTEQ
jgi:hypothetical protein